MKKEDREAILRVMHSTDMFNSEEVVVAEEMMDSYIQQPNQRDYYMVVIENEKKEIVGYMSYGPTPLTKGTYDVYWLAVSPSYQRRGYGKKLIEWLERKVKNEQGRMIIIETSSQPKYESSRQFYRDIGYEEVARIADFYKPGDDRIIYAKRLA